MTSCQQGMESTFASLDAETLVRVFSHLQPEDIANAGKSCRLLASASRDNVLWRMKYAQRFLKEPFSRAPEAGDWREHYKKVDKLTRMKALSWERLAVTSKCRPASLEGHTMCALDKRHFIMFGGFGHGIRNDVYVLKLGDGPEASWHKPVVRGHVNVRYGHTFVRCGEKSDLFVAFGGLACGGYVGELSDVAALRVVERDDGQLPGKWVFEWLDTSPAGDAHAAAGKAKGTVRGRGYAAVAASLDGRRVYAFGGIRQSDCCSLLDVLDVETWTWSSLECSGQGPSKRFGSAAAVWQNELWIVGGGQGNDIMRSGHDLSDVHKLNLDTLEWSGDISASIRGRPSKLQVMGRCNAYQVSGSNLIMYSGSMRTCSALAVLSMDDKAWKNPVVCSAKPKKRNSCAMAYVGGKLVIHGGWVHDFAQVGDLYIADLTLGATAIKERAAERPALAVNAASTSQAAAGGQGRAESSSCVATDTTRRRWATLASRANAAGADGSGSESDEDEMHPLGIDRGLPATRTARSLLCRAKSEYEALSSSTSANYSTSGNISISDFFRLHAMRSNLMELRRQLNGFRGDSDDEEAMTALEDVEEAADGGGAGSDEDMSTGDGIA